MAPHDAHRCVGIRKSICHRHGEQNACTLSRQRATAVQSGPQLPSCQQCSIHILILSQDSSCNLAGRRPDVSAACVQGSQVLSRLLPCWCNAATDAELAVELIKCVQLSTASIMFRLSTYHVTMSLHGWACAPEVRTLKLPDWLLHWSNVFAICFSVFAHIKAQGVP